MRGMGAAAAVSILMAFATAAVAEEAVDIGTVSVTAQAPAQAGTIVESFTREEFDSTSDGDVAGFLNRAPSVNVTSGARGEQLIQLNGFEQRQLLLLIDGAPSAVPFDGVLDIGKMPLPIVERIELVKGAGSVVYGPGGLGGAINLITRSPRLSPLLEFTVEGSPLYEIRASLVHAYRVGPFHYVVYGGFDERRYWPLSDDYGATANQPGGDRIGSGRTSGFGGGKVEVELNDDHSLSLSGNLTGGHYGVPPSTVSGRPRYWSFDPWTAANVNLTHSGRYASDSVEISETLFVSPFTNTLRSYDDAGYNTQTGRGTFTSHYDDIAAGGFVRAEASLEPGVIEGLVLRLWAGGRYEGHSESASGVAGTTDYSRWLLTAAPQIDTKFTEWLTLVTGVQVDAEVPESFAGVIETKDQVTAGPFASITLSPIDALELELSAARRARFPTLKERFADAFAQRVPNPGLGSEIAWNFSLGATAKLPHGVRFTVTGFDSEVSGLIVRNAVGGGQYQLRNTGSARLAGAETALTWDYPDWGLFAHGGYQYLWARRTDVGFPEDQLEYRPEHKAYAKLAWTFLDDYTLTNEAIITGPRPYLDIDTGSWGRLATNTTWNVRFEGKVLSWMALWVAATNILDMNNQSEFGYPEPGRMVWAGLRITR
jgi:iron complex outermembrane receptor protein